MRTYLTEKSVRGSSILARPFSDGSSLLTANYSVAKIYRSDLGKPEVSVGLKRKFNGSASSKNLQGSYPIFLPQNLVTLFCGVFITFLFE